MWPVVGSLQCIRCTCSCFVSTDEKVHHLQMGVWAFKFIENLEAQYMCSNVYLQDIFEHVCVQNICTELNFTRTCMSSQPSGCLLSYSHWWTTISWPLTWQSQLCSISSSLCRLSSNQLCQYEGWEAMHVLVKFSRVKCKHETIQSAWTISVVKHSVGRAAKFLHDREKVAASVH